MKLWEHADLCMSVAKINSYRRLKDNKKVIQWCNELLDKIRDIKEYYEIQQRKEK